jgi:hypothetical protein
VSLKPHPLAADISRATVNSFAIINQSDQYICLPVPAAADGQALYLAFTSPQPSGINIYYQAHPQERSAYLVRVANPSPQQLTQSQKFARLEYLPKVSETLDPDLALLPRHLQAVANASAARWISALSIQPYRQYIETYLANDAESLIDGDGRHVLQQQRPQLDKVGVTHLIQGVPSGAVDHLPELGFRVEEESVVGNTAFRLYRNDQAYPKAYLVNDQGQKIEEASATIQTYTDSRVDLQVTSPTPARLVITDSSTPQWQATVDNQSAAYQVADGFLKSVIVPAGTHDVSFVYRSPAIERAKTLTLAAGLIVSLLILLPHQRTDEKA